MVDEDLGEALNNYQQKQTADLKEIGNEFFKKGDYNTAAEYYKKALEINPNFSDAWNNLGLVYMKLGNIEEAKKCNEVVKSLKISQNSNVSAKNPPKTNSRLPASQTGIQLPKGISLLDGENPIWFGHMSWASQWLLILIGIILIFTIIGIIVSIILFVIVTLNVVTSEYFVSDKRVYMKYGWIRRAINDLKLGYITNVSISQGFMGRILNYGTVIIATPGTYTGTSGFIGVSEPMKVRDIIDAQIQKSRNLF